MVMAGFGGELRGIEAILAAVPLPFHVDLGLEVRPHWSFIEIEGQVLARLGRVHILRMHERQFTTADHAARFHKNIDVVASLLLALSLPLSAH